MTVHLLTLPTHIDYANTYIIEILPYGIIAAIAGDYVPFNSYLDQLESEKLGGHVDAVVETYHWEQERRAYNYAMQEIVLNLQHVPLNERATILHMLNSHEIEDIEAHGTHTLCILWRSKICMK